MSYLQFEEVWNRNLSGIDVNLKFYSQALCILKASLCDLFYHYTFFRF